MKDLSKLGYKEYRQIYSLPYTFKTLWQKKVESKSVCDCNDNLYVDVMIYQFETNPLQFEIGITAEKNGIWYELQAYSLNENDFDSQREEIETKLILMFNTI